MQFYAHEVRKGNSGWVILGWSMYKLMEAMTTILLDKTVQECKFKGAPHKNL